MLEECMFPRKLIPVILNNYVDIKDYEPCSYMFDVVRKTTNVPRNEKPRDYGVFTLKYIECLALGTSFNGLSDETI
ncbi:unnamed protein product [Cochlearia groenlandica]